jgi:hypothetical protein
MASCALVLYAEGLAHAYSAFLIQNSFILSVGQHSDKH